jgi:hypothetical protein
MTTLWMTEPSMSSPWLWWLNACKDLAMTAGAGADGGQP